MIRMKIIISCSFVSAMTLLVPHLGFSETPTPAASLNSADAALKNTEAPAAPSESISESPPVPPPNIPQVSSPRSSIGNVLANLQTSAALDLYAPFPMQNAGSDSERLRVRSAELLFFGPIDHLFDSTLSIAGHDENGEFELSLHEGYIGSTKLIPNARFRVGKFFLGVGRLNQFHQHDWPFISPPKSHAMFFAETAVDAAANEGAADTGAEFSYLLPTDFYLDITAGITNGYCYGHCHTNGGDRPLAPVHYLRPVMFFNLANGSGMQTGFNYLARTESDGKHVRIAGIDLTYKKRQGRILDWLIQSEFYHRFTRPNGLPNVEEIGGYLYSEHGINEQWSAGLRLDAFTTPSLTFTTGDRRKNFDYGVVPVLTYKVSEFSTVRASYTFLNETREGDSNRPVQKIELQLISFLGAHPAHEF